MVALSLRVFADGLAWSDYVRLVNAVDAAVAIEATGPVWQPLLDRIRSTLTAALVRPAVSTIQ